MVELVKLQKNKPAFDELGTSIVAVTVEDNDGMRKTMKRVGSGVAFIRDTEGQLMDLFGLRDQAPNPSGKSVPRSANILLRQDGQVLWVHNSPNYRVRLGPDDVLDAIKQRLTPSK